MEQSTSSGTCLFPSGNVIFLCISLLLTVGRRVLNRVQAERAENDNEIVPFDLVLLCGGWPFYVQYRSNNNLSFLSQLLSLMFLVSRLRERKAR